MKNVYAVTAQSDFLRYASFAERQNARLSAYLDYLKEQYQIQDLPRAILWTNYETATSLISSIPLPAYTNEFRTVFCPDTDIWQWIYLQQLDRADHADIRRYYETGLTENHILQILGHEFVHHSDLFIDEAYESARWFEEGMCEYISRKYFLSEAEFSEEVRINEMLVKQYEAHYGTQSPETFSADTYLGRFEDIFFFYWKSFLTVNQIVEKYGGDVAAVFRAYQRWYEAAPEIPLSQWFRTENKDIP